MKKRELVKEIIILTAAVAIIAAAVFFFLIPSHAAVSSISGLAIVLSNVIPLTVSEITFIVNVVLLTIGFLVLSLSATNIPDTFADIYKMIVVFYFGTQAGRKDDTDPAIDK